MSQQNQDNSIVLIGDREVENWLYQLYKTESQKILNDFERLSSDFPKVSTDLIRAAHTIGSISRTLGVSSISMLGYALEEWLNCICTDAELSRKESTFSEEDIQIFSDVLINIKEMVSLVLEQKYPDPKQDLINKLEDLSNKYESVHQYQAELAEASWDQIAQDEQNNAIHEGIIDIEKGLDVGDLNMDIGDIQLEITDVLSTDSLDLMSGDDSLLDMGSFGSLDDLSSLDSLLPVMQEDAPIEESKQETAPVKVKREIKLKKRFDEVPVDTDVGPVDVDIKEAEVQVIEKTLDPVLEKALVFLTCDESIKDDVSEDLLPYFLEESDTLYLELPEAIAMYAANPTSLESAKDLKQILHTLKGSGAMAGLLRFRYLIHNLETALDNGIDGIANEELPKIVQFACDEGWKIIEFYKYGSNAPVYQQNAKEEVREVSTDGSFRFKLATKNNKKEKASTTSLRVPSKSVDDIAGLLNQYGMTHRRIGASLDGTEGLAKTLASALHRLEELVEEFEIQVETQMQSRLADVQMSSGGFDPLELDRFSRSQELTRMISESMHDVKEGQQLLVQSLLDSHEELRRSTPLLDDAQHQVVKLRNVQMSTNNSRIERLIRQACQDSGKKAEFKLVEDVYVDSGIMTSIMAPMEHILRNAVAHGIESPEKRASLNKEESGLITLEVKHVGNEVSFILRDDGAGINRKAVEKKAKESGLIPEDKELTQEEANEMIFASGFSTAEKVSQLSGRGVGMDVVKAEIIKLGGRLKVTSKEGEGSVFTLSVPSYMAVTTVAPVVAKGVTYGVPASIIEDILVVQHNDIIEAMNSKQLSYHDDFIPFATLCDLVHSKEPAHFFRNNKVLIINDNNKRLAVHVDSIMNDVNLVIRPLCKTVGYISGLVGATVSGDGTPILIVNPTNMSVVERQTMMTRHHTTLTSISKKATVMVVDDSITIRKITEKFLLRENFNVVLAKDGMDAVEKLQTVTPDIFLLDIEMPRMNGFELAEHIRATPATKNIPIIMISSRAIEKYEEHAFNLGVNKYLGKPFLEHELLHNIKLYLGLEVEETV